MSRCSWRKSELPVVAEPRLPCAACGGIILVASLKSMRIEAATCRRLLAEKVTIVEAANLVRVVS
eukprot:1674131-Pyramimonas_sp.AAC.1